MEKVITASVAHFGASVYKHIDIILVLILAAGCAAVTWELINGSGGVR